MASTITRQPMTAYQLVHAIHALSRSHLYTLKAVECLPEKEQEAAAEKVVSELRAFIDQCLPKVERVELHAEKLHPRNTAATEAKSYSITISSPAVTITSSNGIVTAGIDSLGLRDES